MISRSMCRADRCVYVSTLATLALSSLLAIYVCPTSAQGIDKSNGWTRDLDKAVALAKETGQDVFIDFAGDESSLPSRRFLEQVLSRPAFQSEAQKDFVLTLITKHDTEQAPEPSSTPTKLEALQELYQVRGYPTVILADRFGRPYAKFVGYHGESIAEMMTKIDGAIESRLIRDQMFRQAASMSGIERARILHKALDPIQDSWKVRHYRSEMEEIVANDLGNVAGLRISYELQLIRFDAETNTVPESVERLDDMIEAFDPAARVLQEILFTKAALLYDVDRQCSREVFVQARDVDVDSQLGQRIERVLETAFAE